MREGFPRPYHPGLDIAENIYSKPMLYVWA